MNVHGSAPVEADITPVEEAKPDTYSGGSDVTRGAAPSQAPTSSISSGGLFDEIDNGYKGGSKEIRFGAAAEQHVKPSVLQDLQPQDPDQTGTL